MGTNKADRQLDTVVVGAGFAGVYMLYRLLAAGYSARVLEAGEGVGGTWYWNRYPGARSDTQILNYCYSFSPELLEDWHWSERYAGQPEIERYINHVVDRFGLREHITLGAHVTSARYDSAQTRWSVGAESGDEFSCQFLFLATGAYSVPVAPAISGLETFAGELYYTARWPRSPVSFAGKRVGVLGTGSSGMQTIAAVAREPIEQLTVFNRTTNFCLPARNGPMDLDFEKEFKRHYDEFWERARWSGTGSVVDGPRGPVLDLDDDAFREHMDEAWARGGHAVLAGVADLGVSREANARVAEYIRAQVRKRVRDPEVAAVLCAHDHVVGARRVHLEDDYFEVFNRPDVTLVDLKKTPIAEISGRTVVTAEASFELDMLILATGFDSGTGAVLQIEISGAHGDTLAERWSAGPSTYLGLMAAGFPNLFMIAGPGSPSIRSNVIVSIEQHVEWLSALLAAMREQGAQSVEPTPEAEEAWTDHVARTAARTLMADNDTQYVGANIPGKPRVYLAYLGGVGLYRRICDEVAARRYEGFVFGTSEGPVCAERTWSGVSAESAGLARWGAPVL